MVKSGTKTFSSRPKELTVYECRGGQLPLDEPADNGFLGIWSEPPFYYLFFDQEPGAGFFSWLAKQPDWALLDRYSLAYDEWQQLGAEQFEVGPFLITLDPKGEDAPGQEEGIVVRLDPGLVFGSGLHGSTKGCLVTIARLFASFPISTVVDMGTGTGILAVCCALLGAARVLALDKNPLAVQAAKRNVLLNGVENRVEILVADSLGVLAGAGELLVMNLEWPILKQFLERDEWLGYRWVVLSGFLKSQWEELKVRIPPAFRLQDRETVDDWLTVMLAKSESE